MTRVVSERTVEHLGESGMLMKLRSYTQPLVESVSVYFLQGHIFNFLLKYNRHFKSAHLKCAS